MINRKTITVTSVAIIAIVTASIGTAALAKGIAPLPSYQETGTETTINPADIEDLMSWAEETKSSLDFALRTYETFHAKKRLQYLSTVIKNVIEKTATAPMNCL